LITERIKTIEKYSKTIFLQGILVFENIALKIMKNKIAKAISNSSDIVTPPKDFLSKL